MLDELDVEESSGGDGGGAPWMATFADMATLLLTFFILLLTFATMDVVKFKDALGSIQEALGVRVRHPGDFEGVTTSLVELTDIEQVAPEPAEAALFEELKRAIEEQGFADAVDIEITPRGVLVRMRNQIMYEAGEADLKAEARDVLDQIAGVFRKSPSPIMIEGHTDDTPIATARFPSNWELSASRAIAAMHYLVEQGVPSARIGVAGYADQRPLAANDTEERRAGNRRVEFLLVRQGRTPSGGRDGVE